ncbi:UpxY family transcription antiterminator [Carboxylicivirga caseinilyticus]|uniref:UpxY family transcription antiterminator n=1 Tax=Carboxylicivirga caseinilyticus TaxID=3417572 RepID=UPI003D338726|nr:UpxY family transcription antiterminator [Marinilabiliaceae bacterium A049]
MDDKKKYTWYALYTKSRAEKKVLEQLTNMGIKAYLPMKKILRQWSDRKKWVEMPVISSYIFVNILKEDYRKVFEANGVVAYVSYKGHACTIPDSDIEAMRRTIENQLDFDVETDQLKKGQTITVTSGPLKGITGEVLEVQGAKKLYLRISNIGYTLVVDLADASFTKES